MRKGRDIIGKNVVALDDGERLSSVQDLIFDHEADRLLALLVDEGGWFRAAKVVPIEAVSSFGEDAVVVESGDSVISATSNPRVAEILQGDKTLIGTTLMTTDGKNLGKLADLYFDENNAAVLGYDVTGGLFADVSSGRSFVPAQGGLTIGDDVAFVPPETAQAMEEREPGGLRGALNAASQNIAASAGNLASATKERQKEYVIGKTASHDVTTSGGTFIAVKGEVITAQQADLAEQHGALGSLLTAAGGGALQEGLAGVREQMQGGPKRDFVIGKTAEHEVIAGDGTLVIPKGAVVTPADADRAEAHGALDALVTGVGGRSGETTAASDPLEDTLGRRAYREVYGPAGALVVAQGQIVSQDVIRRAELSGRQAELISATSRTAAAGQAASDAGDRLREGAGSLMDKTRSWLSDTRDKAGEAAEEKRIRDAIGRPTNRVILDPQDNILLNLGELITHKAVEAARSSGVLPMLLDSVSSETPVIDPENVKPDAHGSAALPEDHSGTKPS